MIEERGSKRAQQAVVRHLDLDPVKASLDRVPSTNSEAFDNGANIILVHCLRAEMAGWLRHLGRRPHDMRRMLQRSMATVRKLTENLRSVAVDGICDVPQQRNDRRVPRIDEAAGHFAGRMDGLAFDDDQPNAATRAFLVIGHMGICRLALKRAERREMGLEDEAIVQLNSTDSKRAEQQRKPLSLD